MPGTAKTKKQLLHKADSLGPESLAARGYSLHNTAKLIGAGKPFFDCVKELIDGAKHTIHFQTYIFKDDETGMMIGDCLVEAAQRGVQICLLVDGYASQGISKEFIGKLKAVGARFRYFEPLLKSRRFYFGRRLHRKVVVADGARAVVGSMNIANRYNDMPEEKAWFDLALYIEGEEAVRLHEICNDTWAGWKRKERLHLPDSIARHKKEQPGLLPVRARQNDWVERKKQATKSYAELFATAQDSITVVCSYFLPGRQLRSMLDKAAKRNVHIVVVLSSHSDVPVVKAAERYLYRWMLRRRMHIYEYQPVVLHTKLAIADKKFLTLGSYNVNNLSAYASLELNLDVHDTSFVSTVDKEIDTIILQQCKPVSTEEYTTHMFSLRQFLRWSSFQLVRFMLAASTFYYKQRE